jgi:hypothetical protein
MSKHMSESRSIVERSDVNASIRNVSPSPTDRPQEVAAEDIPVDRTPLEKTMEFLGKAEFVRDLRRFQTPQALRELRESGELDTARNLLRHLRETLATEGVPPEILNKNSKFIASAETELQRLERNVPAWQRVAYTTGAFIAPGGLSFVGTPQDKIYTMRITSNFSRTATKLIGQALNPTSDLQAVINLGTDRLASFVIPALFALPGAVAGFIPEPHSGTVQKLASLSTNIPYNIAAAVADTTLLFGLSHGSQLLNYINSVRNSSATGRPIPDNLTGDVTDTLDRLGRSVDGINNIIRARPISDHLDRHLTEVKNAVKEVRGGLRVYLPPERDAPLATSQSREDRAAKWAMVAGAVVISVLNNAFSSKSPEALTNYVPYSIWVLTRLAQAAQDPNVTVQGMSEKFGSLSSGTFMGLVPSAITNFHPEVVNNNAVFLSLTLGLMAANLLFAGRVAGTLATIGVSAVEGYKTYTRPNIVQQVNSAQSGVELRSLEGRPASIVASSSVSGTNSAAPLPAPARAPAAGNYWDQVKATSTSNLTEQQRPKQSRRLTM